MTKLNYLKKLFNMNTVNDAIIKILKSEKIGLSAKEICAKIIKQKLYSFKSVNPNHIVLTQIRRRCEGLNFKSALKEKYYEQTSSGTYRIRKK